MSGAAARHTADPATAWGPVGSLFAALCCLGAAPVVGALAAVGLGFLINDLILIPLLILFLWATLRGLRRDGARHGSRGPHRLALLGAALTLGGLWVGGAVVGAGLALVVGGSLWSWWRVRAG